MTDLTVWRKREMDKLKKELDLLFSQVRRGFGVPRATVEIDETFTIDLIDGAKTLTVTAALPGMKAEDLEVTVTDDSLTLAGKLDEERVDRSGGYERVEKRSRSLTRTLSMPCRIMPDQVKASFKDGVLTIELPKCDPQKPKGVKVEYQQ